MPAKAKAKAKAKAENKGYSHAVLSGTRTCIDARKKRQDARRHTESHTLRQRGGSGRCRKGKVKA